MEINWGIFLAAVVLLVYPIDRLLPAYMKGRTGDALTDPAARRRRNWWRWQPELWADVLRVGLATWGVDFAVRDGSMRMPWATTLATGVILAVGICCQMPARREHDAVFAPLTFMLGAMLALLPVTAALAVFTLAMAALVGLRSYVAFFLTGTALTTGLTYVLGGDLLTGIMLAVIFVVPVLISFLLERDLVLPVRSRENEKVPAPVR